MLTRDIIFLYKTTMQTFFPNENFILFLFLFQVRENIMDAISDFSALIIWGTQLFYFIHSHIKHRIFRLIENFYRHSLVPKALPLQNLGRLPLKLGITTFFFIFEKPAKNTHTTLPTPEAAFEKGTSNSRRSVLFNVHVYLDNVSPRQHQSILSREIRDRDVLSTLF